MDKVKTLKLHKYIPEQFNVVRPQRAVGLEIRVFTTSKPALALFSSLLNGRLELFPMDKEAGA
jgi:hypothetical protein